MTSRREQAVLKETLKDLQRTQQELTKEKAKRTRSPLNRYEDPYRETLNRYLEAVGHLMDTADLPARGDGGSRSAETPTYPAGVNGYAVWQLEEARRRLERETWKIQAASNEPLEQRTDINPDGTCAACGKFTKGKKRRRKSFDKSS